MDRAGDWICGLVFRGVGRGGLVHSMGTHEGLRAVCSLPDCTRAWVTDTAGPRLHRIVAGLATSNYVLANGAGLLIRRLMLKRLSTAFLCGLAIAGQLSGRRWSSLAKGNQRLPSKQRDHLSGRSRNWGDRR